MTPFGLGVAIPAGLAYNMFGRLVWQLSADFLQAIAGGKTGLEASREVGNGGPPDTAGSMAFSGLDH